MRLAVTSHAADRIAERLVPLLGGADPVAWIEGVVGEAVEQEALTSRLPAWAYAPHRSGRSDGPSTVYAVGRVGGEDVLVVLDRRGDDRLVLVTVVTRSVMAAHREKEDPDSRRMTKRTRDRRGEYRKTGRSIEVRRPVRRK